MSTLPLKAISRLWGLFNELTIPYYLRVPGFKLYSLVFGVKLVFASHQSPFVPTRPMLTSAASTRLPSPISTCTRIWQPFSIVR